MSVQNNIDFLWRGVGSDPNFGCTSLSYFFLFLSFPLSLSFPFFSLSLFLLSSFSRTVSHTLSLFSLSLSLSFSLFLSFSLSRPFSCVVSHCRCGRAISGAQGVCTGERGCKGGWRSATNTFLWYVDLAVLAPDKKCG